MRKFVWAIFAALTLTSVVACVSPKAKSIRVKCPACGYEFDVQPQG